MMFRRLSFAGLLFLALALCAYRSEALTNGLALTPPMGWNDWNAYGSGISESIVLSNANLIATNGLMAAGYHYVDIDDCWQIARDTNAIIEANPSTFPDGIAWLAAQVHALGLKQGVYSDNGTATCQGKPGGYQYEYLDAFTYASWGADYLKYDNCNASGFSGQVDYGRMSDGLMKSGRAILFCLCGNQNGNSKGYQSWSPVLGNYWRSTGDIKSTYVSMISHLDPNSTTAFAAGPGRWNDPDMLEIGNGDFSGNYVASQTHFSMWCIMAAPLVMGNKLTSISAQNLAILTNPEAIAVNQDPAGEQGVKVVNHNAGGTNSTSEIWSKTLGYDFSTKAVALFNRYGPATNITCYWTNIGLQPGAATVRDLWAHADLGTFTDSFTTNVGSNAVVLLKVIGTPPALPVLGTNYLSNLQPAYAYSGSSTIQKNKSIGGNTMTLGGVNYTNGIGVNSFSGVDFDLGAVCSTFQATIGIDGEVGNSGTVIFDVFADGLQIYSSGVVTGGSAPLNINLDVTGVCRLILGIDDADDGTSNDHADWANALVTVTNNTPQRPRAPTGLSANSSNSVVLVWNPTTAATNYNVKRATNSGGPYSIIGTAPIAAFSDPAGLVGTNYYYVVSAVSSIGEGANSSEVSAIPCLPPAAPTNVTTSVSGAQVSVSWSAVPGATSYNIIRFQPASPPILLAAGLLTTNYTDNVTITGTNYYYMVTGANACNQGSPSSFVPAIILPLPPGPPTGLTASASNTAVQLSWSAPASGASSYNVKRSVTNGGPYSVIASNVVQTSYLDSGLINGTTYYYVVTAVNVSGEGPNSTQVSATPVLPAPPAAPTGFAATVGSTTVSLSWTASSGATGYNVKRSTTNGGPYSLVVSNIAATAYLDTTLNNGTTYYYVVSGVNAGGESTNSTQVSATPAGPATAYWTNTITSAAQSWNVNANWTNATTFPNTNGVLAAVNANIAANQTINLNQAITVGSLSIGDADGSAAYRIAANAGTLTFSGTNAAVLTELATSKGDTIAAPLTLATNLVILNNSPNTLLLAGAISGAGAMTINNGAVQIGDGTTNGSLRVNLTDNGAVVFSRSDSNAVATVISGTGTLTQNGSGVLILSNANSYSGQTSIAQGTIRIGNSSALGATNGGTLVNSGATLDMNHINIGLEPVTVSGTGVGGNGALVDNSGNGAYVSPQVAYVTLTGNTYFGGTGRWDLRSSSGLNAALSTSGQPYQLTKVGGNQVSIVGVVVDAALGNIDVQQGLLGWETGTTSMGNPASNLWVRAGATISFYQASTHWNKNFVLYGNGVSSNLYNWSGVNVVIGPIQLNGACVFSVGSTSLTLSNALSGSGGLIKNLGSPLILAATNAYTGPTTISAGTLTLTGSSSISNSPLVTIASGATLDVSGHAGAGLTLSPGQTLTGNGTVNGNLTNGSGATLAPGGALAILIFNNALTLAGGGTNFFELSKSPTTNDVAQVAGAVVYGGTLSLTNITTNALGAGDSFKLFNAAGYSGTFANILPASPGTGLAWNTNGLTNGTLAVMVCDFGIGATPVSRASAVGGSVSYTVTLTPTNGFSSNVVLSASGLPAGVGVGFSPNPISGPSSSTLTVTASNGVAAGNYPFTIAGTSGALMHSTNVILSVNDFTAVAAPSSQAVQVGGVTNFTVTIGAINGFSGAVTLSVSGLPPGSSYNLNPTIVIGSGASTFTVTTSNNVAAGNYPLTITGSSGGLMHSTNVVLSVNDFTMAASPASQAVQVGGGTNFTVTVGASNGFGGTVTLSLSGLPAGVGYSLSPTNLIGSGVSTLTVTTSNNVVAGNYPLTITGVCGSLTHTGAVTLSVNDFTVTTSPASQAVYAGGGANYNVTVGSSNGFSGSVALSVSGVPPQASYSFSATNTLAPGASTP